MAALPDYRVYLLDDAGRIVARREVYCADEGEAQSRARDLLLSYRPPYAGAEVWLRERRIAKVQPHAEPA